MRFKPLAAMLPRDAGAGAEVEPARPDGGAAGAATGDSDAGAAANAKAEAKKLDRGMKKVPWLVAVTVAFPTLVLLGSLAVAGTATALSLGYFDLSNPLVGLRIRDDVTAERADAWYEALFVLRPESGEDNNVRQTQQTVESNSLTILYMAPGASLQDPPTGNVFTVENVQKMAALEDALLLVPEYEAFCKVDLDNGACAAVLSPVRYLRNATTQQEIDDGLRAMWADRDAEKDETLFHFCKDFNNLTHLDCPVTRTKVRFGLPLAGFLNVDDRNDEQTALLDDWFWDLDGADEDASMFGVLSDARQKYIDDPQDELVVTFYQTDAFDRETLVILGQDALFVGYSVLVVVVVMSVHMGSLFLGLFGTIQILLSFPTCFFIYRVVLGIELFGGLSIISIYLLLGIATDDIFLFADALRQSRSMLRGGGWTLEKRVAWAFHRAFYTMATTTITTTVAFLILASSKIPVIRYFGIWTALLLVTNLGLVCTMFLSLVVLRERFCCQAATATKEDDADTEAQEVAMSGAGAETAASPTRVERFFRDVFGAKLILHRQRRLFIFIVFGALTLIALGFTTQLRLASKALVFWPDEHYFGLYINNDGPSSFKRTEETANTVKFVWGLDDPPIDRAGTKETLEMDFGSPNWDESFDLEDEIAQLFLRDMCEHTLLLETDALYLDTELPAQDRAKCFMLAFAAWREARNESFPVPNAGIASLNASVQGSGGIPIPARAQNETLDQLLLDFLGRPEFGRGLYANVGFERVPSGNMRVRFAVQEFAVTATDDDSYSQRTKIRDAWDAYLDRVLAAQPESLSDGAYYADYFYFLWQRTQGLFLENVIISICASVITAFVVATFACRNYILAAMASVNVLLVVLIVTASVVWTGRQLGSIESVVVSLSFGISIDFSLHFVVAYSDAYFDRNLLRRGDRVEHALLTLGTSISFGAMSTLLATSMLLLATISFFSVFAQILCVAVASAYLYAIFLLPAALAAFGPEGTTGLVCAPRGWRESSATRIDTTRAGSIENRSPTVVRRVAAIYLVLAAVVVAVFAGMHALRASQVEPDEEATISYEDSYSMPSFASLETGAWTEMRPANDSICARGTPYAFYVKRGSPGEPMIIEFEGGGACWSTSTCQVATGTFADTIEGTRATFERIARGASVPSGLADPNGPYASFTHVYIPYCTADLHAGNSEVNYTDTLRIRHRGNVNVGYVLDYVAAEIPAPPRALITGCSAGSYGSFWHAPRIIKMFAGMGGGTQVVQMGDSGMGVVTDEFLVDSFPNWKITDGGAFDFDIVPSGVATDPLDLSNLTIAELYQWAAEAFPSTIWSSYTSVFDWNQVFFYLTQQVGSATDPTSDDKRAWNAAMRDMYDTLAPSNPPNFVTIIGPGDHHCIIPYSRYYTVDAGNGTPFYQVLHEMFVGGASPVSIDCQDNDSCEQSVDLRDDFNAIPVA